jgi:alpha-methylacyl-CoA racemase
MFPLDRVRVLDLSRLFPGPYCSRILADFGAEVIRIERPGGGDWLRDAPPLVDGESVLFQALNRGKKSVTLNLKSDAGRKVFFHMVETADVLLEGFRPGVMSRLGINYERLAEVNPRLIYCSLNGYGRDGPYRERAGHDLNYVGLSGLLDLTGPRDGSPVVPGVRVADLQGAMWAVLGILLALLARERAGVGQQVDVSLLGAALASTPLALAYTQGGQPLERGGSVLTGGVVCYNVYETKDGGYATLAALEPEFWAAFCRAVERDDLLGQQYAPAVPGETTYDALCALFRSRTRQQWVEAMDGIDACCEPVYDMQEALSSAPVQALGMLSGFALLPPARLSALPDRPADSAPALGEHTKVLLTELGYDLESIDLLRQQGAL